MDNIECQFLAGAPYVWSCEDCPCPNCKAAVEATMALMRGFDNLMDLIAHEADEAAAESADPISVEFCSDVDIISLEVLADRMAGHRTSYLWA